MSQAEQTGPRLRAATLNAYGMRADWPKRRRVMADGFQRLEPDLVAFQEVLVGPERNQVAEVLDDDYWLAHHGRRQSDGQGISIASRWPIDEAHEVELPVTPRSGGFECSALVAEIAAPEPYGPLVFVNHLPDWQLTHEYEREVQTVAVAEFIEELVGDRPRHVLLAGDFDATPDAATLRFWTGRQSLGGVSVCYRDAWASAHLYDPGHTFTRENGLLAPEWELEPGRRIDYLLIRCDRHGPSLHVTQAMRIFHHAVDGVWAADHFGVCADLAAYSPSGRRLL